MTYIQILAEKVAISYFSISDPSKDIFVSNSKLDTDQVIKSTQPVLKVSPLQINEQPTSKFKMVEHSESTILRDRTNDSSVERNSDSDKAEDKELQLFSSGKVFNVESDIKGAPTKSKSTLSYKNVPLKTTLSLYDDIDCNLYSTDCQTEELIRTGDMNLVDTRSESSSDKEVLSHQTDQANPENKDLASKVVDCGDTNKCANIVDCDNDADSNIVTCVNTDKCVNTKECVQENPNTIRSKDLKVHSDALKCVNKEYVIESCVEKIETVVSAKAENIKIETGNTNPTIDNLKNNVTDKVESVGENCKIQSEEAVEHNTKCVKLKLNCVKPEKIKRASVDRKAKVEAKLPTEPEVKRQKLVIKLKTEKVRTIQTVNALRSFNQSDTIDGNATGANIDDSNTLLAMTQAIAPISKEQTESKDSNQNESKKERERGEKRRKDDDYERERSKRSHHRRDYYDDYSRRSEHSRRYEKNDRRDDYERSERRERDRYERDRCERDKYDRYEKRYEKYDRYDKRYDKYSRHEKRRDAERRDEEKRKDTECDEKKRRDKREGERRRGGDNGDEENKGRKRRGEDNGDEEKRDRKKRAHHSRKERRQSKEEQSEERYTTYRDAK